MVLQRFYSKKLDKISKNQFLLSFSLLYFISLLYSRWSFDKNDPKIDFRYFFDSFKILDKEMTTYMIDTIEKFSEKDMYKYFYLVCCKYE